MSSMAGTLPYGPRLGDDEYDRRVVALHTGLPAAPDREQRRRVRRAELELAIDHRLGRDFPRERREALWAVAERIERHRLRLFLGHLLRRLFPAALARAGQRMASFVVAEYATVLRPEELEAYFGADEVRAPGLPVDVGRRKR
jgi:hypothetical protein